MIQRDNKISNYERMRDAAAAAFLSYDQEKMIRKFSLSHDENALYLEFVARLHRIDRQTGVVTWSEDGFRTQRKADYNAAMTIYDVLCDAGDDCCLAHEWVNIASMSAIQGGTLAKGGNLFLDTGKDFTGRTAALACACRALGGKSAEKGDVAYELALFPFLPLLLRFWDADEDFPASLQLLVDRNTLRYLHYETLMFALTHLLSRLREESRRAEQLA